MGKTSEEHSRECLTDSRAARIVSADLASSERLHVERHLASCAGCRRLLSEVLRDDGSGRLVRPFQPRVLQPGMVLAERYRIRRFLGMGGMGEVHEADDLLLGKIVALKTVNARLLGSETAVTRLKHEVAAAHRVTHANVCRIFDLGIDCRDEALGPLMFITMECLEGPTLAAWLVESSADEAERIGILRQLADGLAAAHAAGVVHRDLKPENVMVTRQADGTLRAVITDFGLAGLAQPADSCAGPGLSGTPAYAAPERVLGAPATPASDVFSFALIAEEVLCRRRLQDAATDWRGLPSPWRSAVERSLETNPSQRPANGAALVTLLNQKSRPRWSRYTVITGMATVALAMVSFAVAGSRPASGARAIPPRISPRPPRMVGGAVFPEPPRTRAPSVEPAPRGPTRRRPAERRWTVAPAAAPRLPARQPDQADHTSAQPDPLLRDVRFEPAYGASELINPF